MNYTKQINDLKTCRINGDHINVELMAIDTTINTLRIKRAAKIMKIVSVSFILVLGLLSVIL